VQIAPAEQRAAHKIMRHLRIDDHEQDKMADIYDPRLAAVTTLSTST